MLDWENNSETIESCEKAKGDDKQLFNFCGVAENVQGKSFM